MKKWALVSLGMFVLFVFSGCAHSVKTAEQQPAVNVIVMIGDGMGVGQIEVGRLFEHGKEGRLYLQSLPNVALMQTYSADNFVTDSAAAGTALATGYKTNNQMTGVTPDGTAVDSLVDICRQKGKKLGIISSNTVYDATPAAFTINAESRYNSAKIVQQLYAQDLDILLGGGAKYFAPKKQEGVDYIEKFKTKGYTVVKTKQELNEAQGEKILGLFHGSYMSYQQDREETNSQEPSLKEMTAKAIDVLSKNSNGFFLMSEGARIDHAAHAADIPGVWKEMVDFDNAVRYAVEWAKENGNTIVLVLADHETMSFGASEGMDIEALKAIQVSPEYMAAQMEKDSTGLAYIPESVKAVFKTFADIDLNDEETNAFNKRIVDPKKNKMYYGYQVGWEIGSIIAEKYHGAVMSTTSRKVSKTGGHTGNMVPVFAYGAGADGFEGILDNTEVFSKLKTLLEN
jgi:alkaline phosphatase